MSETLHLPTPQAHVDVAPRTLVDVSNLSIGFADVNGGRPLVRGVDLTIRAGECVALVGESGSGKSLTARSLIGLAGAHAQVRAERFEIDGRAALTFRERDWRAVRGGFAGLVMQDTLVSLDPLRTVGREIGETLARHGKAQSRAQRLDAVHAVMRDVGIPEPERRAMQYAHELSGGLRQRALIASAMAASPALVIADEPTTALDVTVQAQVLAVLEARLRAGVGVLLISHDLGVVAGIADRVIVMQRGEVVDSGPTRSVLDRPSHPYTRQLLAARPGAQSRGYRLASARFAEEGARAVLREPLPVRTRTTQDTVLRVDGIGKRYARGTTRSPDHADAFVALEDVSFDVREGEVLGIVGESGSGKSTSANIVLGLLAPTRGTVEFLGKRWNGAGVTEAARAAQRPLMRYIPQDPLSSFDPRHTVRRLLADGLHTQRLDPKAVLARSIGLLEQVGLDANYLDRLPISLSGGQRQRIAIARAIASEPVLIVCDEPVSALDVYVQAQVLDLLGELQARLGTALLFISHDLDVVQHVSDRVIVLKDGRVVEGGKTADVFGAPQADYTKLLLRSAPGLLPARRAA